VRCRQTKQLSDRRRGRAPAAIVALKFSRTVRLHGVEAVRCALVELLVHNYLRLINTATMTTDTKTVQSAPDSLTPNVPGI